MRGIKAPLCTVLRKASPASLVGCSQLRDVPPACSARREAGPADGDLAAAAPLILEHQLLTSVLERAPS